jgi:hypothetical protein
MLMRVSSRYFIGCLVFDAVGYCTRAAPIFGYVKGEWWSVLERDYKKQGFKVEILKDGAPLIPGRRAPRR